MSLGVTPCGVCAACNKPAYTFHIAVFIDDIDALGALHIMCQTCKYPTKEQERMLLIVNDRSLVPLNTIQSTRIPTAGIVARSHTQTTHPRHPNDP